VERYAGKLQPRRARGELKDFRPRNGLRNGDAVATESVSMI